MKTLIIVLFSITTAIPAVGANIYRVDGNGDIIDGPVFFSVYDRDGSNNCRVSDLGYVYFSDQVRINCFDSELNVVTSIYLASGYACLGIDNVRNKVISEDTISIFSPTLVLEGQFEVLAYVDFMTVDDYEGTVWYTKLGAPDGRGLYKCSMTGDPIYYFPETHDAMLSSVSSDGEFWVAFTETGLGWGFRLRERSGTVLSETPVDAFDGIREMEMYFADGSLWAIAGTGGNAGITKVNSAGNIVYNNTTDFDRPYAIYVNQNDGSVWIADTYNYQLVHLDANGEELLRKDWDYVLVEVAVDHSDNTLIVVDDTAAIKITPSSLGRIKAGFAE